MKAKKKPSRHLSDSEVPVATKNVSKYDWQKFNIKKQQTTKNYLG